MLLFMLLGSNVTVKCEVQTDRSNIRFDKSHVEGHKMIKVAIIIILSILIDFWNKSRKHTYINDKLIY